MTQKRAHPTHRQIYSAQIKVEATQGSAYDSHMISSSITVADICEITGFTRHKLRGLLRELPEFGGGTEKARVAREYSAAELLVIAICCELEESFGLRRKVIGSLSDDILHCLSRPRELHKAACLHIQIQPQSVSYFSDLGDAKAAAGLTVPLANIFERIDSYIKLHSLSSPDQQRFLNFGPIEAPSVAPANKLGSSR